MADKELEKKAVNVVFSKMKHLHDYVDVSDEKQERPDFVYRKDNQILGVEHIEIPLLPTKKGQNSRKFYHSQYQRLISGWKRKYPAGFDEALEKNNEAIAEDLEKLVNEQLNTYTEFTYVRFLKNALELLGIKSPRNKARKHNATEYLSELKMRHPECECRIAFVLDIGYTKEDLPYFRYKDRPGDEFESQSLSEFPFTLLFIRLLGYIEDVRDVYIVWHPHDEYKGKGVKCYGLHYDENHNRIGYENIRYYVWEFDVPEKHKGINVRVRFEREAEK